MKGNLSKYDKAKMKKIAEKLRTNSVIIRYCKKHKKWEWFDPIDYRNGWFGSLPGELSKEEVKRTLEKLYFCPMCDSIHAAFRFI
ncbi:MAG: hypothetical protein QXO15_03330 [Nitrososphaerota archaeon]